MGQPQAKAEPRGSKKRLRIIEPAPKAPGWSGEAEALEKVGGELGLVLWKALRRVRLWSATEPERRKDLFLPVTAEVRALMAAAGVQAPELIEAVGVFTALLRAPERADGKQLAEACNQVYQWANEQAHSSVAMYFAEAAAAADPTCPGWAIDSGWMCRRVAGDDMMERSAAWYDRAFGLAVRAKDRQEIIRALTGYGALMKHMGRYEKARVLYERAAQRAARTGRLRQAAVAQHYLLGLAAESGNYLQGERCARRALEQYPIHDSRIPHLAHDYAYLLIRNQLYSLALPLLYRLLSVISHPGEQVLICGSIARAAGGIRKQDAYNAAERQVLQLIEMYDEFSPSALNSLAEGAYALGDSKNAASYATRALKVSEGRRDALEKQVAENLLERIATQAPAHVDLDSPHRDRIGVLVQRFTTRLQKWKAPGPERLGAVPSLPGGVSASGAS